MEKERQREHCLALTSFSWNPRNKTPLCANGSACIAIVRVCDCEQYGDTLAKRPPPFLLDFELVGTNEHDSRPRKTPTKPLKNTHLVLIIRRFSCVLFLSFTLRAECGIEKRGFSLMKSSTVKANGLQKAMGDVPQHPKGMRVRALSPGCARSESGSQRFPIKLD